jgi:hypothetical protein
VQSNARHRVGSAQRNPGATIRDGTFLRTNRRPSSSRSLSSRFSSWRCAATLRPAPAQERATADSTSRSPTGRAHRRRRITARGWIPRRRVRPGARLGRLPVGSAARGTDGRRRYERRPAPRERHGRGARDRKSPLLLESVPRPARLRRDTPPRFYVGVASCTYVSQRALAPKRTTLPMRVRGSWAGIRRPRTRHRDNRAHKRRNFWDPTGGRRRRPCT